VCWIDPLVAHIFSEWMSSHLAPDSFAIDLPFSRLTLTDNGIIWPSWLFHANLHRLMQTGCTIGQHSSDRYRYKYGETRQLDLSKFRTHSSFYRCSYVVIEICPSGGAGWVLCPHGNSERKPPAHPWKTNDGRSGKTRDRTQPSRPSSEFFPGIFTRTGKGLGE
jgi:hypothetical protein